MSVFINFSNHPSQYWDKEQKQMAMAIGTIVDIAFPQVSAESSCKDVEVLAKHYSKEILRHRPAAVMCQGEFTLSFQVIRFLQLEGIPVLAACSERVITAHTSEYGCYEKTSVFKFVQFREYSTHLIY